MTHFTSKSRIVLDPDSQAPLALNVEWDYYPGSPDVHTLPNGDPGYPGDLPELNILSMTTDISDGRVDMSSLLSFADFEEWLADAIQPDIDAALQDTFETGPDWEPGE
jgi:hypothetical protein